MPEDSQKSKKQPKIIIMNDSDPPDKKLNKEDQEIWDSFAKESVELIEEGDFEALLAGNIVQEDIPQDKACDDGQRFIQSIEKKISSIPAQLDRRTEEKLRKGKFTIEGKLDLHGLTQAEAHEALNKFIEFSIVNQRRCILVITGKGKSKISSDSWLPPSKGILKQRVPEWLSSPPLNRYILKFMTAQPKDGGSGALYVYLKRQR